MDNLLKAIEATDKHIYQLFLKHYNRKNKKYKLIPPEKTECPYDLTQLTDTSKDLIEIKVRHKYSFESFDDISIDTYKLNNLLLYREEESATSVYICAVYPKSDKIILIDITFLDYEYDDIVKKSAKWHTISTKNNKKIDKLQIPLNIKQKKDTHLCTKTYQYSFPHLKDTYIDTFKKYCKKYNVPENIMKEELKTI